MFLHPWNFILAANTYQSTPISTNLNTRSKDGPIGHKQHLPTHIGLVETIQLPLLKGTQHTSNPGTGACTNKRIECPENDFYRFIPEKGVLFSATYLRLREHQEYSL